MNAPIGPSPRDRRISALSRAAALERWGVLGDDARREATAPARRGLMAKFEQQVRDANPGSELTHAEVVAGAERLMRAHMTRIAQRPRGKRRSSAA